MSKHSNNISDRQKSILSYIINEIASKHIPPTVREIGEAVGLQSSSTVHNHLTQLENKGYLQRDPAKPRSITVLMSPDGEPIDRYQQEVETLIHEEMVALPVYGNVAAGAPIFADESLEDTIPLPMRFVRKEGAFMLRIRGDSMIGVGIFDGDYVIVAPQVTARNGDIVVALIGDEATCKTYYKDKQQIRLQPENPDMEPIYAINPQIIGIVIGLFRDMQ